MGAVSFARKRSGATQFDISAQLKSQPPSIQGCTCDISMDSLNILKYYHKRLLPLKENITDFFIMLLIFKTFLHKTFPPEKTTVEKNLH